MTSQFSISTEWASADHGPPEVRETSGFLNISIGEHIATRAEDDWSKSVRPTVRVSAYPLALWFAASWWRLRWEPSTDKERQSSIWKMAHETPAAGYGFIWPRLVFESDGEVIDTTCFPSFPMVTEPIRYLEHFRASISAKQFEQGIDNFVALVIARLDAVGVKNTHLRALWQEVVQERADVEASAQRRLEARLGFEPDEAPTTVIVSLLDLRSEAGPDAVAEIAPACAGPNPKATLQEIIDIGKSGGIDGRVKSPSTVKDLTKSAEYKKAEAWVRGRLLAGRVRSGWGLGKNAVSDDELAGILEIPAQALRHEMNDGTGRPLGLAVRLNGSEKLKINLRRRARTGRRFEVARLLVDSLIMPTEEHWLPTTDAKTSRQKAQRAFAAEFLCPIDALVEYLDSEFSAEAIEEAGDYFGVSPLAIRSHLANNGLIHPDEVTP